jgi:hypothetical protein
VYEVLAPIQFKQGEQFGYDGEFPKAMATVVMPPEEAQARLEAEQALKENMAAENVLADPPSKRPGRARK